MAEVLSKRGLSVGQKVIAAAAGCVPECEAKIVSFPICGAGRKKREWVIVRDNLGRTFLRGFDEVVGVID